MCNSESVIKFNNNNNNTYKHIRTDKDSYMYSFDPTTIIQWNLLVNHVDEAVTVDAFKVLLAPHS